MSVTWHWSTNYWLDTETDTHGFVTPGDNWYTNYAGVTVTAHADSQYIFDSWTGDVPAGHESDNPLSVTMDQSRQLTAGFIEYTGTNILNVPTIII